MKYTTLLLMSLATAALLVTPSAFAEPTEKCSQDEVQNAQKVASALKDWNAMHQSYVTYGNCANAAIRKGFSKAVAMLLSDKYPHTEELATLAQSDPDFLSFVVSHVDNRMTPAQEDAIKINATRCRPDSESVCVALRDKLDSRHTPIAHK